MKKLIFIFILFTISLLANDILPSSKIYIDHTKDLTINDILKENLNFKPNDKISIRYGYAPKFNVWIKFTLENNTNKTIKKIIEYDNNLATSVQFFDKSDNYTLQQNGLLNMSNHRTNINPIFTTTLKPNDKKTLYIKASSQTTALIVKLNLYNPTEFYKKENNHQNILSLFFGAMLILIFYNLFIYFFTKDISYLYYVFAMSGIVFHQSVFTGYIHIYFFDNAGREALVQFASLLVLTPIVFLALFIKSFLNFRKYVIFDKILNILIVLSLVYVSVFLIFDFSNNYRNIASLVLFLYLIILTIYEVIKKNKQAYFILAGWSSIFLIFLLMYLENIGIFTLNDSFKYISEIAILFEAIIFSIALANRITTLQNQRDVANMELILQKSIENTRLEKQVILKTNDLKTALDEKVLLLKELNHRVKNNMQTIVSLIRLQSNTIKDKKTKDIFSTIEHRLNAMKHLHELLYKQDNITHINSYEYIDIIFEEIKDSYESDINILYDISFDLKAEQAIYCGLILNELITNSFKYAFLDNQGEIKIKLFKNNDTIYLDVEDNGKGYDKQKISKDSLGLFLVDTLVTKQLKGQIDIDSSDGTKVKINWKI
ncbi:MAG: histidine kinase [Epsilonproteobacteria bacterium]|nr:MAG: histidine kinase [Campylobacterota bacterium]